MTTKRLLTATADKEAVWAWWVKSATGVQACRGGGEHHELSQSQHSTQQQVRGCQQQKD